MSYVSRSDLKIQLNEKTTKKLIVRAIENAVFDGRKKNTQFDFKTILISFFFHVKFLSRINETYRIDVCAAFMYLFIRVLYRT